MDCMQALIGAVMNGEQAFPVAGANALLGAAGEQDLFRNLLQGPVEPKDPAAKSCCPLVLTGAPASLPAGKRPEVTALKDLAPQANDFVAAGSVSGVMLDIARVDQHPEAKKGFNQGADEAMGKAALLPEPHAPSIHSSQERIVLQCLDQCPKGHEQVEGKTDAKGSSIEDRSSSEWENVNRPGLSAVIIASRQLSGEALEAGKDLLEESLEIEHKAQEAPSERPLEEQAWRVVGSWNHLPKTERADEKSVWGSINLEDPTDVLGGGLSGSGTPFGKQSVDDGLKGIVGSAAQSDQVGSTERIEDSEKALGSMGLFEKDEDSEQGPGQRNSSLETGIARPFRTTTAERQFFDGESGYASRDDSGGKLDKTNGDPKVQTAARSLEASPTARGEAELRTATWKMASDNRPSTVLESGAKGKPLAFEARPLSGNAAVESPQFPDISMQVDTAADPGNGGTKNDGRKLPEDALRRLVANEAERDKVGSTERIEALEKARGSIGVVEKNLDSEQGPGQRNSSPETGIARPFRTTTAERQFFDGESGYASRDDSGGKWDKTNGDPKVQTAARSLEASPTASVRPSVLGEHGTPENVPASQVQGLRESMVGWEGKSERIRQAGGMEAREVTAEPPVSSPVEGHSKAHNATEGRMQAAGNQPAERPEPVVRSVAGALAAAKDARGEIILQLKPESLGRLRIRITSAADRSVSVRIVAESSISRDIIEKNIGELKTELRANGIEMDKCDVLLNEDQARDQGPRGFNRQVFQGREGFHGSGEDLPSGSAQPMEHELPEGLSLFA